MSDTDPNEIPKLTIKGRLDNLKTAFRRSSPSAKAGILLMTGMAVMVLLILIKLLGPSSTQEADGEYESSLNSFDSVKKDSTAFILEETESIQGQLVINAEIAKNKAREAQGTSSFLKLTTAENGNSPYSDREKVAKVKEKEKEKKSIPQKASNNKPLNSDVIRELMTKPVVKTESEVMEDSSPYSPEGRANIYLDNQLKRDPLAGLDRKRYTKEMASRKANQTAAILAAIAVGDAKMGISGGIQMIAEVEPNESDNANGSRSTNNGTGPTGRSEPPPMLLAPGESIVVTLPFDIDSRVPGPFIMNAVSKPFKGAALRCTWIDNGDFLVPSCSDMTIRGKTGKLEAMVINPRTMGRIVDQDVDDDLLFKSIARISASLIGTWGVEKLKTGNKVVENTTSGTISSENTLTDRDIFLGAAASTIGDLTSTAEQYYQSPSVKTIKAGEAMILVMTRPLPDWWGFKKDAK